MFCVRHNTQGKLDKYKCSSYFLTVPHVFNNEKWTWDSTSKALMAFGQSLLALVSAYDAFNNYNALQNTQCFVAGTLVLTIDGNKPIEEIKAGDLVYSTDPETGNVINLRIPQL